MPARDDAGRPRRRLPLFLGLTFAITYGSWWVLAALAQRQVLGFGEAPFMALYMLGGFGPTIAGYASVLLTRHESPLRDYHARLLRWRAPGRWYLVALGLPFALSAAAVGIAVWLDSRFLDTLELEPWYMVLPLFGAMIVGGGLEEPGWRGVAQPELERRWNRWAAATAVGVIWALWHLPLFHIPGVGQHGGSFALFAASTLGLAYILAALAAATDSILLCVAFHAAFNAAASMGLDVPSDRPVAAAAGAGLKLAVGLALLSAVRNRPARSAGAPPAGL